MYEFKRHTVIGAARPQGRISSTMYSDGKLLYVFGGFDPTSARFQEFSNSVPPPTHKPDFLDLWAYDLSKRTWTLVIDKDRLLLSDLVSNKIITAIFYPHCLMIYTYATQPGWERVGRKVGVIGYSYKDKKVSTRYKIGKQPIDSAASNMISHEKSIYGIRLAGFKKTSFDVYKIDSDTLEFRAISKYDKSKNCTYLVASQHTLAYDEKSIFVIGGYIPLDTGEKFIPLRSIPAFDIKSETWKLMDTYEDEKRKSDVPAFPVERVDFSITQFTDPHTGDVNVVIFGGTPPPWEQTERGTGDRNDNVYTDLWKLNLKSMKWKYLGVIPSEIGAKPSVTVSPYGQLFIFGGIIKDSNGVNKSSSEIYSTWLYVPD